MPTYEYECLNCGHRYELFQMMSAAPRKTCPKCRKQRARRLIGTGSGIIFKGSGFYATDYRKPDKKSQDKNPHPQEKKPECSKCSSEPVCKAKDKKS
ncbi:FmdB family zinc ribbon protein [Candidatus Omnitrophota bacterium]